MPCQGPPMNCTSIISATSIDASGETVTRSSKCRIVSCLAAAHWPQISKSAQATAHWGQRRIRVRLLRSKLYFGNFAFRRRAEFEKLARFEIEHAGDDVRWKLRDLRVEVAHHGVVITARVLNRVLDLIERLLQLVEALHGPQLRIRFGQRE